MTAKSSALSCERYSKKPFATRSNCGDTAAIFLLSSLIGGPWLEYASWKTFTLTPVLVRAETES
jgi:hypothetical protein